MNIEQSQADGQLTEEVSYEGEIEKLLNKGAEVPLADEEQEDEIPEDDVTEEVTEEETDEEPDIDSWKSQEFDVNGEKVSGAELASGYMKDADYRQKTAQAAQLRRDAEQKLEYVNKEISPRLNRLDVLTNALYQEIAGDQSQLAGLVESDPAEYLRRSHYLANRNQLLQQAMSEREAVAKMQEQTSQRQLAEYVQHEQGKLVEALPEWRDRKVAESEMKEVAEYLMGKGYEHGELSELYDHRALVLARKAMLYDKRANLKPSNVKPSVSIKPGSTQQTKPNVKVRDQLRERAIKSQSRDDFADAIKQYL